MGYNKRQQPKAVIDSKNGKVELFGFYPTQGYSSRYDRNRCEGKEQKQLVLCTLPCPPPSPPKRNNGKGERDRKKANKSKGDKSKSDKMKRDKAKKGKNNNEKKYPGPATVRMLPTSSRRQAGQKQPSVVIINFGMGKDQGRTRA